MGRTKVVLNIPGFDELRKRAEVEALVKAEGDKMAARAGEGFSVAVHQRSKQVVANVYTETADAMRAEAKHGALSKAVNSGG